MEGSLWSAATNQWTPSVFGEAHSNAASGDGYWFAEDYMRLDSQANQRIPAQVPEFFSILLSSPAYAGEKMNGSGSLLYSPVPTGSGAVESNGDVTDTNTGEFWPSPTH